MGMRARGEHPWPGSALHTRVMNRALQGRSTETRSGLTNEGRTMTDVTTEGLIVVAPGGGEPRWIGASRITLKATAAQTKGCYGLMVSEAARGTSPPLHIHHSADEAIWVVSGRLRVRCGEDEFTLEAGGFTLLPGGVPHTFLAEEDTTMLGLISPGGTEAFFVEGGPVATASTPAPPDLQRMERAAQKYACEFVGPPLTLEPVANDQRERKRGPDRPQNE
jgi:quercetin dioxygenase-like cupin family protein